MLTTFVPIISRRSLFEQLQSNKAKADEEWEESRKFKNQIARIDDDEADFLDTVDELREKEERRRMMKERKEIEEYRKTQVCIVFIMGLKCTNPWFFTG